MVEHAFEYIMIEDLNQHIVLAKLNMTNPVNIWRRAVETKIEFEKALVGEMIRNAWEKHWKASSGMSSYKVSPSR